MRNRRSELPQTLEECHALILELYDTIDELRARIAQLERELYGTRRERFIAAEQVDDASAGEEIPDGDDPDMQVADDFPADASLPSSSQADSTPPDDDGASPPAKPPRSSAGRRPRVYPADTPRVPIYHPLDETTVPPELLHNPRARRFYRFVREEVELPQRRIRILEHYQEVIVVDDAEREESTLCVAAVPEPLLESCYASDSLLAYLAVSRFADHLPYYREEDIVRRSGLSIPRSTQWRWMRQLGRVLSPLVENIRQHLLQGRILGIDETPCPMLDPTLPNTRQTYLYAQYGDDTQPYVSYYFAEQKTRANIESMLAGFEGVLQSDAYICYELITAASLDRIQPA